MENDGKLRGKFIATPRFINTDTAVLVKYPYWFLTPLLIVDDALCRYYYCSIGCNVVCVVFGPSKGRLLVTCRTGGIRPRRQ